MKAEQLKLIDGYYRCQNCGKDVDHVQKVSGFWICDDCYASIVVPTQGGFSEETWRARERFAGWVREMKQRYPQGRGEKPKAAASTSMLNDPDLYYPYCKCGRLREKMPWHGRKYCPICSAKRSVESVSGSIKIETIRTGLICYMRHTARRLRSVHCLGTGLS